MRTALEHPSGCGFAMAFFPFHYSKWQRSDWVNYYLLLLRIVCVPGPQLIIAERIKIMTQYKLFYGTKFL